MKELQFAKALEKAKETKESKIEELDEVAAEEKKAQQQRHEYIITKQLNKFELKDIASIPNIEAIDRTQTINMYTKI